MGNIQTEITRIANAKADIRTAINNKGGNVSDTALIDTFATVINSLKTSNNLIPIIGIGINGYMTYNGADIRCVPTIVNNNGRLYIVPDFAKENNKYINKTDSSSIYISHSYLNIVQFANAYFYYEHFKNMPSRLFNLELLLLGENSSTGGGVVDNMYTLNAIQRYYYTINSNTGLMGKTPDADDFLDSNTLNDIINLGTNCIVLILT